MNVFFACIGLYGLILAAFHLTLDWPISFKRKVFCSECQYCQKGNHEYGQFEYACLNHKTGVIKTEIQYEDSIKREFKFPPVFIKTYSCRELNSRNNCKHFKKSEFK